MTELQRYKELHTAASKEVSRLSEVVAFQQGALRSAEQERDEWKRRFDRLLNCCRSVS